MCDIPVSFLLYISYNATCVLTPKSYRVKFRDVTGRIVKGKHFMTFLFIFTISLHFITLILHTCITNFLPVPSVLILKVSRVICLRFSRPRQHKNVITSNQHLINSPCGVQGLSATPLTS
jgi:hypothetical protein